MRKSIFDIEIRVDISTEYNNLKNVLLERESLYFNGSWYSLYKFLNDEVFPVWKHKGLFIDFQDFLEKMDINISSNNCDEEKLLYMLELLVNIWPLTKKKLDFTHSEYFSKRVIGYMELSIPTILEKLNYQTIEEKGIFKIVKRDADVDSIIEHVPKIASLLLEYNDIRNNNIKSKRNILKEIDLYIEEKKNLYKSINNATYESIQRIVNELGVNHPIHKEYKDMPEQEICKWYDKCFKAMIHLIRCEEINEFNDDRKKFFKKNGE